MATEVVCIVDTDGEIDVDCDYLTLAAAIAGESGVSPKVVTGADLVDNDEQLTIQCRASDGTVDSAHVTVAGFTTDADCYVKITSVGAHRHTGEWSDLLYRLAVNDVDGAIQVAGVRTVIEGLQIRSTNSYRHGVKVTDAGRVVTIDGCILLGPGGTDGAQAINIQGHADQVITVRNSIIDNFARGFGRTNVVASTWNLYANTVVNCTEYGIGQISYVGTINARNNIVVGSGDDDFDLSDITTLNATHNISSDDTAPGTDYVRGALIKSAETDTLTAAQKVIDDAPWVIFTDPAAGDYSLHSEDDGGELNDAVDAGTDLSAVMDSVDIIGTERPQGDEWDIGAFEALGEPGPDPEPQTEFFPQGCPQTGGWTDQLDSDTPADLVAAVVDDDDDTFIQSTFDPEHEECVFKLENLRVPESANDRYRIRVRMKAEADNGMTPVIWTVALVEDWGEIGESYVAIDANETTNPDFFVVTLTLTSEQMQAVGDWDNLYLVIEADTGT